MQAVWANTLRETVEAMKNKFRDPKKISKFKQLNQIIAFNNQRIRVTFSQGAILARMVKGTQSGRQHWSTIELTEI